MSTEGVLKTAIEEAVRHACAAATANAGDETQFHFKLRLEPLPKTDETSPPPPPSVPTTTTMRERVLEAGRAYERFLQQKAAEHVKALERELLIPLGPHLDLGHLLDREYYRVLAKEDRIVADDHYRAALFQALAQEGMTASLDYDRNEDKHELNLSWKA